MLSPYRMRRPKRGQPGSDNREAGRYMQRAASQLRQTQLSRGFSSLSSTAARGVQKPWSESPRSLVCRPHARRMGKSACSHVLALPAGRLEGRGRSKLQTCIGWGCCFVLDLFGHLSFLGLAGMQPQHPHHVVGKEPLVLRSTGAALVRVSEAAEQMKTGTWTTLYSNMKIVPDILRRGDTHQQAGQCQH